MPSGVLPAIVILNLPSELNPRSIDTEVRSTEAVTMNDHSSVFRARLSIHYHYSLEVERVRDLGRMLCYRLPRLSDAHVRLPITHPVTSWSLTHPTMIFQHRHLKRVRRPYPVPRHA